MFLEESKIWEHASKVIDAPTDLKLLTAHVKKEANENLIVLDPMKDHFIPEIVEKIIGKNMFDTFVGLYQSSCVYREMLLRNKFLVICMSKTYTMVSYLTKPKLRDQLTTIAMKVEDNGLVFVTLNGLSLCWMPFV
jgi:hypothetical protein